MMPSVWTAKAHFTGGGDAEAFAEALTPVIKAFA